MNRTFGGLGLAANGCLVVDFSLAQLKFSHQQYLFRLRNKKVFSAKRVSQEDLPPKFRGESCARFCETLSPHRA